MLLGGLQKLTLIDYPDKVACTVFTVGCNFRCPFCHNPELVMRESLSESEANVKRISEEEFFDFLSQRKGILDGVCVTGGEPTIQSGLIDFIKKIKEMGFLVKLDTNGTNPEMLKELLNEKLLDYIAMDVKNNVRCRTFVKDYGDARQISDVRTDYVKTAGVEVNIDGIKKSIEIIKNSGIDYEFRTTVVPSLHKKEDILAIANEIRGAKKYYLQQFESGQKMLNPNFKKTVSYSRDFLEEIRREIKDFFEVCEVRGV